MDFLIQPDGFRNTDKCVRFRHSGCALMDIFKKSGTQFPAFSLSAQGASATGVRIETNLK